MSGEYLLTRDADESRRLTEQHEIYVRSLGYLISPTIAANLPSNPQVADIGTGTGAWALATAYEDTNRTITGIDISDKAFPPQSSLPANLTLRVHDIRKPFPPDLLGRFDVVHARLLLLAMPTEEAWTAAVKNIVTILKPQGWIQWVESDFKAIKRVVRWNPDSKLTALRRGFLELGDAAQLLHDVPEKLCGAFTDAGLQDVAMDCVASNRVPELREVSTNVLIGASEGFLKHMRSDPELAKRLPGTEEDDRRLIEDMYREARGGAYSIYFIHAVMGRKKA